MQVNILSLEAQHALIAVECSNLGLEANDGTIKRLPGFLERVTDSVKDLFTKNNEKSGLQKLKGRSFIKALDNTPYLDLVEVEIPQPLGMSKSYPEYLSVMKGLSDSLSNIESRLLKPLSTWLAINVEDPSELSKLNDTSGFKFADTGELTKSLGKVLDPGSEIHLREYGKLVKRNKDWLDVCEVANEITEDYNRISNKDVLASMERVLSVADIIIKELESGKVKASNATIKTIADSLYQAALEMELYGVLGNQINVFNTVIPEDLEVIEKAIYKK